MNPSVDLRRLRARLADCEAAPTKLNLTFFLPSALDDVEMIAKDPSARDAARQLVKGFGQRVRDASAGTERRLVEAFVIDAVQRLRADPRPSHHLQAELRDLTVSEPETNAGLFAAQVLRNTFAPDDGRQRGDAP